MLIEFIHGPYDGVKTPPPDGLSTTNPKWLVGYAGKLYGYWLRDDGSCKADYIGEEPCKPEMSSAVDSPATS